MASAPLSNFLTGHKLRFQFALIGRRSNDLEAIIIESFNWRNIELQAHQEDVSQN